MGESRASNISGSPSLVNLFIGQGEQTEAQCDLML